MKLLQLFVGIGMFLLAYTVQAQDSTKARPYRDTTFKEDDSWGAFSPSQGFVVSKTKFGTMNISGYAMFRYLNQKPENDSLTDHLGNTTYIDSRRDLQFHRAMLFFKGWIYNPKFSYNITVWTVMSTQQVAVIGNMGYSFHKAFNLFAGVNGLPGTRSLNNSHPLWLGTDRVMIDDFIRPGFTSGVFATGEPLPGLCYNVMVGNNLSQLGITAGQLTRDFAYAGTVYWMPLTREFGPKGGFGDWEFHTKPALRIGACFTSSNENRYNQTAEPSPDNTQIKNSDSKLFFSTGALANGVTVETSLYQLLSTDFGFKYKGIFIQTEWYYRSLSNIVADGPVPLDKVVDKGFYVQSAFFPVPQKFELYASTSQLWGQFNRSYEYIGGLNYYPFGNRFFRLNGQVLYVNRCAQNSVFGYYVGGQTGMTYSVSSALFF